MYISTRLHGVVSRNTVILTALGILNLPQCAVRLLFKDSNAEYSGKEMSWNCALEIIDTKWVNLQIIDYIKVKVKVSL